MLLSDAQGPLFVFETIEIAETGGLLGEAERGGLKVAFGYDAPCEQGETRYYPAHLAWDGGSADLQSGEQVTVPVLPGPRDLVFLLAASYRYLDCQIHCDSYRWLGWAAVP